MTVPPATTSIRLSRRTFTTRAKAAASRCACGQQARINLNHQSGPIVYPVVPLCPLCASAFAADFLAQQCAGEVVLREKRHKPMSEKQAAAVKEALAGRMCALNGPESHGDGIVNPHASYGRRMRERGLESIVEPSAATEL